MPGNVSVFFEKLLAGVTPKREPRRMQKASETVDVEVQFGNRYTTGRIFDPGALRMGLDWNTTLPAYHVLGPGNAVQRQLGVNGNGGSFLPEKALIIQGALGFGTAADFQVQQGLTAPHVGSTGSSTSASI